MTSARLPGVVLGLGLFLSVALGSEVCYDVEIGCFTDDAPFFQFPSRPVPLPASPDLIGTVYNLFTRQNQGLAEKLDAQQLDLLDVTWRTFKKRPTRIIVHGYVDDAELMNTIASSWMIEMKDEFLKYEDCNVIIVDWSKGNLPPYIQATANTRVVGAQIAALVLKLEPRFDMNGADFHIIGHSLGSHIAGYAGERITNLGRISGVDPAGPLFENTPPIVRLDPTDAILVDAIHTDGKSLLQLGFGTMEPNGHMDFYPNSGADQRGCSRNPYEQTQNNGLVEGTSNVVACNHLRSYKFYTESINSACPFISYPCYDAVDFENHKCHSCAEGGCAYMGFHADMNRPVNGESVRYFLTTAEKPPFCLFHLDVTITFSSTEDAVAERGYIALSVSGSKDGTSKVTLNSEAMVFNPGESYYFTIDEDQDIGDVQFVSFSFDHDSAITDPSQWNFFGLRNPYIIVEDITVFSERSRSIFKLCAGERKVFDDRPETFSDKC